MTSNTCFNLINPLAWFVQNNNAQTTPILRSSSGTDLKVKPMLGLFKINKQIANMYIQKSLQF